MINLLVHTGAVMYGYTSDVTDFDCGVEFVPAAEMNWRDLRGLAPLPDVILSNTPPSSSLPQSHSHAPGSPHAQPTPPSHQVSYNTPAEAGSTAPKYVVYGDRERGQEGVQTGLKHIQEVRRRLQSDPLLPHHNPHPHHYLPQLSWHLQGRHHPPQHHQGERLSDHGGEEGQQEQWRHIGLDLRKVADQFQVTSAKVAAKRSVAPLNLTVPEVFTRCLSAFVLGLVWWRFFNKLR